MDTTATAPAEFVWTKKKQEAARLLAEDDLSDQEIAQKLGVHRASLVRWKQVPVFAARMKEVARQMGDVSRRCALARKGRRLRYLEEAVEKIRALIKARGLDPDMAEFAGGELGIQAIDFKAAGKQLVRLSRFDAALMKEYRELLKQIAQEVGDWTEKHQHEGADGGPVKIQFIRVNPQNAPAADRTQDAP